LADVVNIDLQNGQSGDCSNRLMRVSRPLRVSMPPNGVLFAESIHAEGFRMAERVDPFHKLIYVLSGRIRYNEPSRATATAGPGSFLVVPRGASHQIVDEITSTILLFCLTNEFIASDTAVPRLWTEISRWPGHKMVLSRSNRQLLEGWWRRAMAEQASDHIGGDLGVRIAAKQTLLFLARLPVVNSEILEVSQRVKSIVREVDETFFEEWNLTRGAARAGLSRRRFSELFRSLTGETFWNYLMNKRIKHAAHLLRRGEHSVFGAMFSCGISDLSNFYRLFRRRYGMPPKRWARQNGA
jgi:AraC-like DNA-binding protein